MKLYSVKNSKTGKYITFNGEILICNSIEVFGHLMRLTNEKVTTSGKKPLLNIDDYDVEDVNPTIAWHLGKPSEKGDYLLKYLHNGEYSVGYWNGEKFVLEENSSIVITSARTVKWQKIFDADKR